MNSFLESIKKYISKIIFFTIILFLQEGFFSKFIIFGITPNIYILSLFIILFYEKEDEEVEDSVIAGIIWDLFSFYAFGIFTVTLFSSGFLTKKFLNFFQRSNILTFIISLILFIIFYEIVFRLTVYAANLI